MAGRLKAIWETARDAVWRIFSSPFFFVVVGSGFIFESYKALSAVGRCGDRLAEIPCLKLSHVNLAYGLLFASLGAFLVIYGTALHATHQGQVGGVKGVYREIKSFFGSPIFFILLGLLFLYCGLITLDETHSGFVFILAVLGIAMVLFGTGSQAVASGGLPAGGSTTVNVSIAGGAAVLAAVFGYGIVYLESGIHDFFKRTVDYGFLELTTKGTANQTLDLDEQIVNASTVDGRPLHLWKQTGRLQIMVPRYSRQATASIVVAIRGPRIPPSSPPFTYDVDWATARPVTTSGNERIYITKETLTTPLAPTTTLHVDDSGRPLPAAVEIPPPQ